MVSSLKHQLKDWILARPRAHEAAAPLIRLVRPGRADLLPRRPPNQVPIQVPGCRPFYMLDQDGRDQIVRDVRAQGWAAYERPLPQVLAAVARRSRGAFWDVGANTGFYTLLALACGRHLTAQAFEPFPPAAEALAANLAINRIGRRARLVRAAVGSETGSAELWLPPAEHGLIETSSSLSPAFKETHSGSVTVSVTRLDDHPVGRGRPSILKVDVESLEHVVLGGAGAVLRRFRPLVFLEVLPKGDITALEAIRREHGYTDIRLRPDGTVAGDPVRFDEDAWNHLLVPDERLAHWLPTVQSVLA